MAEVQHVCLSGALSCSGVNPCPECRAFVQGKVIPVAFVASRVNEVLYTLKVLVNALADRGVDPSQFVDLRSVWDTPEEQAEAFFGGYVNGWRHMHEEMQHNAALRDRFKVTTVAAVGAPAVAAPAVPGKAPVPPPAPPGPPPALEPLVEDWDVLQSQIGPQAAPIPVTSHVPIANHAPVPISPPEPDPPLDAEGIALAGLPLSPEEEAAWRASQPQNQNVS